MPCVLRLFGCVLYVIYVFLCPFLFPTYLHVLLLLFRSVFISHLKE